jgi:N utilization substance protein B
MPNNRRVARECALKMLFAHRFKESAGSSQQLLDDFWGNFRFADDALGEPLETVDAPLATATRLFAEEEVRGVVEYRAVIDQKIRDVARNWSLERMAPVDLGILRIGAYELLYREDVPVPVTINEAVEIAKRYGTKESPSFVNGLLDKIAQGIKKS